MARKLLIRTKHSPYHITGRSNNKDHFYVAPEPLWQIFLETMKQAEAKFGCNFHAYVLMSNHYHLIISTPRANIDKVMEYIQKQVATRANRRAARINHFFGGPYKWSLIYEESYYWNAVKYVFRNPIRAGLCKKVDEYPYSSLNRMPEGFTWKMVDFFHDKSKPITLDKFWLDAPFLSEAEETIRLALRRKEFKISRHESGYRPKLDTPLSKK